MKKRTVRKYITLPESMFDELEKKAQSWDLTYAEYIRYLIFLDLGEKAFKTKKDGRL